MSRNAAMNMPPPPPHVFHGYAGTWAQTADVAWSSSGYQPSWNPAGISTSRSRTWEHHLGRVQAALNGSSTGGRTGAMVARAREELLHSLLLGVLNNLE